MHLSKHVSNARSYKATRGSRLQRLAVITLPRPSDAAHSDFYHTASFRPSSELRALGAIHDHPKPRTVYRSERGERSLVVENPLATAFPPPVEYVAPPCDDDEDECMAEAADEPQERSQIVVSQTPNLSAFSSSLAIGNV